MADQLGKMREASKPFPRMKTSFTACSMGSSYAMCMTMKVPFFLTLLSSLLVIGAVAPPDVMARGPKDEQDAARRAMLEGRVMPFSVIKRRLEREMGDATYVGSEFHPKSNRYRLKYVRDGRVVWVDVDGRTGEIAGLAH